MTKNLCPTIIEADNVSQGWGRIVSKLMEPGVSELSPLLLTISDARASLVEEETKIRTALDQFLEDKNLTSVDVVAWTIFPEDYWKLAKGNRDLFFREYAASFQRVQEFNKRDNRKGSYFQRLIDHKGGGRGPNQLDFILRQHDERSSSRRSMWQATVFDAARDHSRTAQLQFPCLQQVSFTFLDNGAVVLNAFYATQQLLKKGYGNYLGLLHLGRFMAEQMGRPFEGLSVYVGVAKIDGIAKSDPMVEELLAAIHESVASPSTEWAA